MSEDPPSNCPNLQFEKYYPRGSTQTLNQPCGEEPSHRAVLDSYTGSFRNLALGFWFLASSKSKVFDSMDFVLCNWPLVHWLLVLLMCHFLISFGEEFFLLFTRVSWPSALRVPIIQRGRRDINHKYFAVCLCFVCSNLPCQSRQVVLDRDKTRYTFLKELTRLSNGTCLPVVAGSN